MVWYLMINILVVHYKFIAMNETGGAKNIKISVSNNFYINNFLIGRHTLPRYHSSTLLTLSKKFFKRVNTYIDETIIKKNLFEKKRL